MGMVVKGKYQTSPPDLTTTGQYSDLQVDADGRLKVSTSSYLDAVASTSDADIVTVPDAGAVTGTHGANAQTGLRAESYLAGATSRTGYIGTLAISGVMYVRLDAAELPQGRAEWLVKSDKAHAVQLYKSRAAVDSVTITLGGADLDNADVQVVNGKTFTAHTNTTVAATGQYAIDGNTAADCIELAKVLAPGVAVTLASTAAADTVTVNDVTFTAHTDTTTVASREFAINGTDAQDMAELVTCLNHKDNVTLATVSVGDKVYIRSNGVDYTYTAAASAVVDSGVFSQNGSDTQDGDSLVLCINHKDHIDLTSAIAGDSVTINGLTFTGKASTAILPQRKFSIDTSDDAASISLAACINDATWGVPGVTASGASGVVTLTPDTYDQAITVTAGVGGTNSHTRVVATAANGVPGVTAVNASGVVSLTRNYEDADITLTSSNGTRLACVSAKGVPGILATAGDGGEALLTPVWRGETITVTSSDDTIKYTDYGLPGCSVSYTATTVVITPDMYSAEPCTCIYAVISTNTDASEFAVTNGTLANLEQDGAATTGVAAITTNLGKTYEQYVDGYPYLYLGFTSEDAAAVSVPVVKATLLPA